MYIDEFIKQHPVRRYPRGQIILLKGDSPQNVLAIKSGFVKGYDIDTLGNEQLLWVGSHNDIFPLSWALGGQLAIEYFFSAFTDVELYVISRQKLGDFLAASHAGVKELAGMLAGRMADAFRHLNAAEKAKADEKLAHTLYFLSRRFGQADGAGDCEITLPLTHQDIANLLGLTRETVAGELKKLKAKGIIDYDKTRFIVHQDKLEALL